MTIRRILRGKEGSLCPMILILICLATVMLANWRLGEGLEVVSDGGLSQARWSPMVDFTRLEDNDDRCRNGY
ncbi:hypothetical protein BGZ60DRAFT_401237 [Tricladium varicosporioides]|nr:hypothetical protein BGZ60DRAFT_401237 [Hymenoscyphus varicosporioides]